MHAPLADRQAGDILQAASHQELCCSRRHPSTPNFSSSFRGPIYFEYILRLDGISIWSISIPWDWTRSTPHPTTTREITQVLSSVYAWGREQSLSALQIEDFYFQMSINEPWLLQIKASEVLTSQNGTKCAHTPTISVEFVLWIWNTYFTDKV